MPESLLDQVQRHEREIAHHQTEIAHLREDLEQTKAGARWLTDAVDQLRVRLQRLESR